MSRRGRSRTQEMRRAMMEDYAAACRRAKMLNVPEPEKPKFTGLYTVGQVLVSGNRKYRVGPKGEFRRVAE